MNADAFDTRICELGEGPLWHPERQQFFWFDILGMSLLSREGDQALEWQFDEHVSAAGWIDHDRLMVASETALWQFDLSSGEQSFLCALEAENPVTRSNDGRADPWPHPRTSTDQRWRPLVPSHPRCPFRGEA